MPGAAAATKGGITTAEDRYSSIPASGLPTIEEPTKSLVNPTGVPKLTAGLVDNNL